MGGTAAYKLWSKLFNKDHFIATFEDKTKKRTVVGLDRVSSEQFAIGLENNINIILRKCQNGTYRFTHYRELLVSKGAFKPPRRISIPTVRDALVLSAINEMLVGGYDYAALTPMPQVLIKEIAKHLGHSDFCSFIKIDISTFYPSINHFNLKNS